jgi:hypothetical protein
LAIINDFDRMGVENPMKDSTKITNICTTKPAGIYCDGINQCDTLIKGRRDLLIISYYIFNYLSPELKDYVYYNIFKPTKWASKHFNKHVWIIDNKIDYTQSENHEYLFMNLTDENIIKYYKPIDMILNDDDFIGMCLKGITHTNLNEYDEYSFYNITKNQLFNKYEELKNQYL